MRETMQIYYSPYSFQAEQNKQNEAKRGNSLKEDHKRYSFGILKFLYGRA